MKQRNRRPRIPEELVEERRRREVVEKSFQEPTPEELLAMVNGNPEEVWRSDQMAKRTDLATKVDTRSFPSSCLLDSLTVTVTVTVSCIGREASKENQITSSERRFD
jgi:hypothetical protein